MEEEITLTMEFDYPLNCDVQVIGTDIDGRITHCGYDNGGIIYLVRSVNNNGAIQTGWYRENEIG